MLAQTFLQELVAETGKDVKGFTPAALEIFSRYGWPGNIRELRNTVERSLLSAHGEWIDVTDLPNAILGDVSHAGAADVALESLSGGNLDNWLADVERQAISQALAACHGVQAHAAKKLGISERSLWHRIKKLGIQISRIVT